MNNTITKSILLIFVVVTILVISGGPASAGTTLVGKIDIHTTPPGATVLLDGDTIGTSPVTLSNVAPGTHTLVIKKTGYTDYQATVMVSPLKTKFVSATLRQASGTTTGTGSVYVSSTPTGATILLDGTSKGTTPATLSGISTGTHTLVIKKTGYTDYQTSVTVSAGKTVSVAATLQALTASGSISVSSSPTGATILLDGTSKGTTPATLSGISTGTHTLVIKKTGYNDYKTSVTVSAGKTVSVAATLTVNPAPRLSDPNIVVKTVRVGTSTIEISYPNTVSPILLYKNGVVDKKRWDYKITLTDRTGYGFSLVNRTRTWTGGDGYTYTIWGRSATYKEQFEQTIAPYGSYTDSDSVQSSITSCDLCGGTAHVTYYGKNNLGTSFKITADIYLKNS
jgi:hypothetical protein